MHITLPTATDAWKQALATIEKEGKDFTDDTARTCRELLGITITIQHPDVAVDEPIELVSKNKRWNYPSKEELANIIFNKVDIPFYDYTYGSRLFNYQGNIDQINDYIIPLLKKTPASRRATAILYDPQQDQDPNNRNAPGLISLHFKIDEDKLTMTSVIRSNDMLIGWPANIYQLATLQQYIAEKLGVKQGPLSTISISAHLFLDNKEVLEEALK